MEREMEDEAYHFERCDINLVDVKKSNDECLSLVEPEENLCKSLNYEEEIKKNGNENFTEDGREQVEANGTESKENVEIILPPATSLSEVAENPSAYEESNFERQATFKAIQSSPEPKDPYKMNGRLVRLQVAPNYSSESLSNDIKCNVTSSASSITVQPSVSQDSIFSHEIKELPENCTVLCNQDNYQFLTPEIPSGSQQVYISQNTEGQLQLTNATYQTIEPADILGGVCATTNFEPVVVSSHTASTNTSASKTEKVQPLSSPIVKTPLWTMNSSSSSGSGNSMRVNTSTLFPYSEETSQDMSSDYPSSSSSLSENPDPQHMQRYVTVDNQVVYGYKDASGEFHFFCPAMNERESHNEKERRRRSRVSDACTSLRKLIPGMSDKTDKATVFEQAARYLKFLREKFGSQFDQSYCEKYFQERS